MPKRDICEELEIITLQSMKIHFIRGLLDVDSVNNAIEFLIKANFLLKPPTGITLLINSVGGSCYDTFGLIDLIKVSEIPITTIGIGNIASMALLLLVSGNKGKRYLMKNTQVMAHQHQSSIDSEKLHELKAFVAADERLHQQMLNHFLENSNMTKDQINKILLGPTNRWLTQEECLKFGLVDKVIDYFPK